ncbi:MAG TPA: (d)CMP kinase [Candidatus Acidoferrales bacterium]|nr:(d)CMP kinase [Candidatus Acidoferrales bacterium]
MTDTAGTTHDDLAAASSRGLVVALDGPASSGKSSVGAAAAARLGYRFCDTGLLYRAVTWLTIRRGVAPENAEALVALVREVQLLDAGDGRLAHVSVDGVDETAEVHGPEVDVAVSAVSRVPELRAALLQRQRSIVDGGRIIMAGRDIGTVVLPDADLKLFLDASVGERAARRARERGLDPDGPEAAEVLAELRRRDDLDSNRPVAPLRVADDAVVIRSDGNAFEETVELVVAAIRAREGGAATPVGERAAATATLPAAVTPSPAAESPAVTDPTVTPRSERRAARPPRGPRRAPAKPTPIADRLNLYQRFSGFILRSLARGIARMRVEGDPNVIPKSGALIVASNHASSADGVLVGAFLNKWLGRPLNWLGKRELVEMPVIGPFMRGIPIHPVDRDAADLDAFRIALRILESGNVLGVFPEGTRSRDGALQTVREGAGVLALHSGAMVLPVGIVDSDRLWPKGKLLPRYGTPVAVRYGKAFRVTDEIPGIATMSRRQANAAATHLIMLRIAELLPPRQRGVFAAEVEGESGAGTTA